MKRILSLVFALFLGACGGSSRQNIVLTEAQKQASLAFIADATQLDIVDAAIVAAVDTSGNSFFSNTACVPGSIDATGQSQLDLFSGNVLWQAQSNGQFNCSLGSSFKIESTNLRWSGQSSFMGLGQSTVEGDIYFSVADQAPQLCEVSLQINAIVNLVTVQGFLCKIPVQASF